MSLGWNEEGGDHHFVSRISSVAGNSRVRIKIAQKKAEMNWGPQKKGAMFPLKKTESRVMPSRQALTCVMKP